MNLKILSLILCFALVPAVQGEELRLGSTLALKGKTKGIGIAVRRGLEAALEGKKVRGKTIHLIFKNDFYEPEIALQMANDLVNEDIFMAIGSVGTPTAKVTLPVYAKHKIPVFGFFTGANILRTGANDVFNFRASYFQETESVISEAVKAGLDPDAICAYVQNDPYGLDGLKGVYHALSKNGASKEHLSALKSALEGNKEGLLAPVGFHIRNTIMVRAGVGALDNWEKSSGKKCLMVVTVGTYENIAHFIRHNSVIGKKRIFSTVSFTGAASMAKRLKQYNAVDRVIMTQVVPVLHARLPIVREAQKKLGNDYGPISFESYIVGKLALHILKRVKGKITRENFVKALKSTKVNIGGVKVDFTKSSVQGSQLVVTTYLKGGKYLALRKIDWMKFIQEVAKQK